MVLSARLLIWNFAILSCYIILCSVILVWPFPFLIEYDMLDSFSIRLPPLQLTGYTYRTFSLLYVDPFFFIDHYLQRAFLWVFILNLQLHRECRLCYISRFPFACAVTINHLPSLCWHLRFVLVLLRACACTNVCLCEFNLD